LGAAGRRERLKRDITNEEWKKTKQHGLVQRLNPERAYPVRTRRREDATRVKEEEK
jgi:hypothetical protein